ncbi:MAG: cytochrome c3 family protein [Anaerolineales bacterium]
MIKNILNWLASPLGRVGLLILALVVISGLAWGVSLTQAAPEQPIPFPHNRHVGLGVQCLYCHPGSIKGPVSGLPTQTKCWGCHQQLNITATSEKLKPLVAAVESGEPLQWVPVAMVPDFVQYNHRPHIAAGLNCEDCHGNVSQMEVYENPQVLNMGWCLNCHVETAGGDQEMLIRLTDCGTCHY